ncbi:hypothetical protein [Methylobacterium marchantiae]|uniref:Uncharacterized protein n=1 Tax=Methylobacterium marchantiae TaxID=600331 RepID=A0ABW3X5I0_9HYPH|nr:hypothetical protein AIGOOFII_3477 [Methylobacterium marchantiae]
MPHTSLAVSLAHPLVYTLVTLLVSLFPLLVPLWLTRRAGRRKVHPITPPEEPHTP